jgi:hypothetical protein
MTPQDAPGAAQSPSALCRRCGRPISPTPYGYGHAEAFPRLVEGDRHHASPTRSLEAAGIPLADRLRSF